MSCYCENPRATLVEIQGVKYCEVETTVAPSCKPKSCPPGYTLSRDGLECILEYNTGNLCPEGYLYVYVAQNPEDSYCEASNSVPAECDCLADVIASPQTICSGDNTSVALTSTLPSGVVYSWVVLQTGVNGGTSGNSIASGNTISQPLVAVGTTPGTAIYTITPYEQGLTGCAGTPVQVTVTVNPKPNIVVVPTSPQTISSGDSLNIVLSSGIPLTTFAWTVTPDAGVTGATSGTGSVITDTLTCATAASVVYHIVATAPNGCTNTLEYTINIGATIEECLAVLTARVFYDNLQKYSTPSVKTTITMTGTSGTGNIIYNGTPYAITFNTNIAQTVNDFYNTHITAFSTLGGVALGYTGNAVIITRYSATTPVISYTNTSGNLSGSLLTESIITLSGSVLNVTESYNTPNWSNVSSTAGHQCNAAKYNFMTNGVALDCYHYLPAASILPSPSNVKTFVDVVNLNNSSGSLDFVNKIVYGRTTSPSMGEELSRESFAEYSIAKSSIIQSGLSPTANTLKIRLKGTGIMTYPGSPTGQIYSQHSSVIGLQFFINGISVYDGVIGSKTLEIDPCNFVPGQTLTTYESSTGGSSIIDSITIGTQLGTLQNGTPVVQGTVTQDIIVNVTQLGTYDFIAYANGVTFRTKGSFTTLGSQTVTLEALGTPIVSGASTFEFDLAIPHPSIGTYWYVPPTFAFTVI